MERLATAVIAPALLAMAVAGRPANENPDAKVQYTLREILDAIRFVESSGRLHPPDGDAGRSIGPYQIQKIYWVDSKVPGDYQDCRRIEYAERVIAAYMQRWVPESFVQRDAEVIARIHNGGPRGMHKHATLRYWRKVQRRLQRIRR